MHNERPIVDGRDPADAISETVDHVLRLANSWVAWYGRPVRVRNRVLAPHKVVRRVADHMIDHLTQFQASMVGITAPPDLWHASAMTSESDLAPFTAQDLDEARSRLERLALLWRIALANVAPERLDRAERDEYTPREMAFCAVASTEYADALGDLS